MKVRIFVQLFTEGIPSESFSDTFIGKWNFFPEWLWNNYKVDVTKVSISVMEIYSD
jgi:hypothetical protein